MRPRYLAGLLAVFLLSSIGEWRASGVHHLASEQRRNLERSIASYEALQRHFQESGSGLYLDVGPDETGRPYAYAWPFSQVLAATIDISNLPNVGPQYRSDVADQLRTLEYYWNPLASPSAYESAMLPPIASGGDIFYDDNEWIGLELVRIYRMTGDGAVLDRAMQVFDLVASGWNSDPSLPAPGGVHWTKAAWSRDRNTVSTAPGAQLGLHLYGITGEPRYLEWSRKMYDWTNAHMLAPNGLYWDHIDMEGNVERTQWSYNQGAMIGASVLLHQATGQAAYLERAKRIANAALDYYGTDNRWRAQGAAFNAIFFKNLLLLTAEQDDPRYRRTMLAYADQVWETNRDPQTGLFQFDPPGRVELLHQAAMVQIYACLAWDPDDYHRAA